MAAHTACTSSPASSVDWGSILPKLSAALNRDQRRDIENLLCLKPKRAETEESLGWVLRHLTQRMVDLLWHQWSSIGVAGYACPDESRIIDPEALILATTRFGRHDSRLMDESIDGLVKFGNRISLQRLQGLNKYWPGVADPRVLMDQPVAAPDHFQAAKWRDALAHCAPALAQAGRVHAMQAKPGLRGSALVKTLMTDLGTWLDWPHTPCYNSQNQH